MPVLFDMLVCRLSLGGISMNYQENTTKTLFISKTYDFSSRLGHFDPESQFEGKQVNK